jgi:TetR/AcrR family transcriptional regulator, biofilm operon repressor
MKCKIIAKATDMFLRLGFKSVTMDDIANEMSISKKTIYKYFENKELLISEGTMMFKEMFHSLDHSPVYQLKKHYPEIHDEFMCREAEDCNMVFRQNMEKGIREGLYRENINIDSYVKFYYTIIFFINETTKSEKEVFELEYDALEYHTRALATPKGIIELEKNLIQTSL